ncbi:MAG: VTT domain-containing protein [Oscillospiraceae bacterium]|nr:VTT domain-containing protein [Oscillospiraceae bacterium]
MKNSIKKRIWIWSCVLAVCWTVILVFLLKNRGGLTMEELLDYEPESPLLAVLILLGLYLLKSVDFLMHSGILYAAAGVMFPLPGALLLNTLGVAVICTTPYWLGRSLGAPLVEYLLGRYPKLKALSELRLKNDFVVSLLFRVSGLPLSICSMYMGAMKFDFRKYLLGSVLGFFPVMADYTVLGLAADDPGSPVFLIAIGIKLLLLAGSALVYRHLAHRANEKQSYAQDGEYSEK